MQAIPGENLPSLYQSSFNVKLSDFVALVKSSRSGLDNKIAHSRLFWR